MAELFKYKTVNKYLLDSLKNKYLYFSKPSELDDIFECKISPSFTNTTDAEINNWMNLMHQNNAKDFPYNNIADIRNDINSGVFEKNYINNSKILEHYHILSLCKDKDNQRLWSLYAATYKGICIGYNVDLNNNYFELEIENPKNKYKEISTPIANIIPQSGKWYARLKKTDYNNEGQFSYNWINEKMFENSNLLYDGINNSIDRSAIFQTILNSKSSIWIDQNEYRCFFNDMGIKMPKIYYPDETLNRIVFGYKTEKKIMKKIYKLITKYYRNTVIFEVVKPNYSTRKLEFSPYMP